MDTGTLLGAATARAPSHLSAFFVPGPVDRDYLKRGSKGAGVCLERGVEAHVRVSGAEAQRVVVERFPGGGPSRATTQAVHLLLRDARVDVHVKVTEEVPAEQGFGVSAGSALATTLALAKALHLARSDAVAAAHTADIQCRTGLGDVSAATVGGVVVRPSAGLPPYGTVHRLPVQGEIVVCVVGPPIETKGVLADPARMALVKGSGEKALAHVLERPTIERVFDAGRRFARETGIPPPEALEAVEACEGIGAASVAMIGATVFAYGDTDALLDALRPWGQTGVSTISLEGAHVVQAAKAA